MLAFAESIQLIPDGTLLIHIAIIISMVFVLNRLLFKPLLRTFSDREARTHGRTDEARETIRKVGESLSRYENSLRQARAEGYSLLEQRQSEANGERQLKVAEVRREVEEQLGQEKDEIQSQAERARATLLGEAGRVAADIKAQVLRR
ncbi:MAG: F-type H+-transporting ATPase subunit b [Acidobacteriota bacterium]|jgi:F-type H+-transporting ATPase subunit b|nr:F-type H+-transporting ATPase subunit b [Acidobacteriota bacterium]